MKSTRPDCGVPLPGVPAAYCPECRAEMPTAVPAPVVQPAESTASGKYPESERPAVPASERPDNQAAEDRPESAVRSIIRVLVRLIVTFLTVKRFMRLQPPYQYEDPDANAPRLPVVCEECGATSFFPATLDGTTQDCSQCGAFVAVGNWDLDWDAGETERSTR